jgi:uncharacterized FlgJ-related protein
MRLSIIILFIGLLGSQFGCANSGNKDRPASGLSGSELDTLIYSNPQNYLLVLDDSKKSRKFEVRSYKDMLELFEELNYTPAAWQSGIREVPRVYLPMIGDKWGSTTSKEITVENKKQLFFRGLAPLILRANELIMIDRDRLKNIRSSFEKNKTAPEKDQVWLQKLAQVYKVNLTDGQVTSSVLDELWQKTDIVPVSLALAQAAEESGWGTSRFAAEGNSVYGQWSWGKNAITPEKQRKELGNYGIASFETLQQSVCAYMLNLNTHNAYASLRDKRAALRKQNKKITGYILAGQLTKYSERGEEYVQGLRSLMEVNKLAPADDAYLSEGPPIYLVPAVE